MKTWTIALAAACVLLVDCPIGRAADLPVGPEKKYATIADALADAKEGDTILVHAQRDNKPYEKVALMVRTPKVTFKAVPAKAGQRVPLSGKGFDYSGSGSTPRAIFQFDPWASGCTLEGFELLEAHNASHNGAGVRINQANHVTVRDCEIHACDMGIMSNGNGTPRAAVDQRIEGCHIHDNGSLKEPGQNHNLYLGGTSVTLSACEVHSSLTGHNVKSRAHFTRVEYSYIHDSANRELDLVDGKGDTSDPGSDAVLVGNIIVKNSKCDGNRGVIHFGADGGHDHDGTLYLVHNTIVTPFVSPVVDLSAAKAKVQMVNNIVWDGGSGQGNQKLVEAKKATGDKPVGGSHNWLSAGFNDGTAQALGTTARVNAAPPFVDAAKRDFHLKTADAAIVAAGVPWADIKLPATPIVVATRKPPEIKTPGVIELKPTDAGETKPGEAKPGDKPAQLEQYKAPLGKEARPGFKADAKGDLGAFGFTRDAGKATTSLTTGENQS